MIQVKLCTIDCGEVDAVIGTFDLDRALIEVELRSNMGMETVVLPIGSQAQDEDQG